MSQKFGWAIGGALVGWLLGWFGFQANEAGVASAQTLHGLTLMLSVFPALGALLSAACMAVYPLGEPLVKRIVADLEQRRGTTAA
jgi:GPH family glycoside/pentoside/hexuronide:cation symporter